MVTGFKVCLKSPCRRPRPSKANATLIDKPRSRKVRFMQMSNYINLTYHQAAAPQADGGRKEHLFIASDDSIMASRRRLNPEGWNLEHFKANPVVLENHNWIGLPIGTARAYVEQRKLFAAITFALTPRAREIEQLVEDSVLRAVSVSWESEDADIRISKDHNDQTVIDFLRQTLREISIVTMPDNIHALKVAQEQTLEGIQERRAHTQQLENTLHAVRALKEYIAHA